jgi:hypothetical protein
MPGKTIEHPIKGWNDVPGDPFLKVWWDGTTFTHSAIHSPSGWEVVSDNEEGDTRSPAPDLPPRRRFISSAGVVPAGLALFLFCSAVTLYVLVLGGRWLNRGLGKLDCNYTDRHFLPGEHEDCLRRAHSAAAFSQSWDWALLVAASILLLVSIVMFGYWIMKERRDRTRGVHPHRAR